ncbi:zf-TFIIB domain-containing protein [Lacibacter sp.]|uniref:TFIIB-type zinc ribbon-containing protein n=1 Tax=Lacibacter sp. TaxID=1915409 RepID=UPI002B4B0F99|nr:zf-TFIIB domain-containing protein [Lacibacter sp.]HLP35970.1 zf-TFIIB domain-containing protein [Lacibacter sp.]
MKCPVCTTVDLVMSERQGIEIDYCPTCRGIWLDRGELDKIIDRVVASEKSNIPVNPLPMNNYSNDYKHHDKHQYKHHKKHWLNDLFD